MADIYDWSLTPASNASADSAINWAEGMDPDQVNDSARQMMTRVAEVLDDIAPTRSTTGTGNAYAVVTAAVTSGAYNDGEIIACIVDRANTSACTLNSNGRGAVAWRPEVGREFAAGELRANQPVLSFYRSASNEFLAVGSGYHVNAMTSGALTQSVVGRLMKIGTPYLSMSATVETGSIRLTQTTQTLNKADWPELSSWLSGQSFPWGSTSTTFNLPPAAGYFLRFAATSSAIDTSGARTAGSTQSDQNKTHDHAPGTLIGTTSSTTVNYTDTIRSTVDRADGGTTFDANVGETAASRTSSPHLHSVTVNGGLTGASGGDEVRVKNVAFHVDVFASSALATGALAQFGFSYAFDASTTSSDPGSGNVRLNNATLASVTEIYISETDGWGVDISGFLSTISNGVRLRLSKIGAQASTVLFTASGAPTDNGGWRTIPGVVTVSGGSFTAGDSMAFEQFSGAAGPTGNTGTSGSDGGFKYTFDSSTTMGAPAAGGLRLNNATIGSATAIAIANTSADAGNPSVSNWINTWDDSTTTAHRGVLYIREASTPGNQIILDVTSAVTDNSTWLTCTVSVISSNGTFSNGDSLLVSFSRTGDKGLDGAGSGTVTSITAGAGLSSSGVGATGGALTVSGTLTAVEAVNAQTGTSYTILAGDHTKLVSLSNTSSVGVTVPQATSSFGAGFWFDVINLNSGVVTLTPTTSLINGAASFALGRFESVRCVSDGTNWQVIQGGLRGQTVTVASATTCDIGAVASHRVSISGTTTITGLGTVPNQIRFGSFTGILTLTHNATSLILPGGASITTAAGDTFVASSDSSGNWRFLVYQKASGAAVTGGSGSGSPSIPQGRLTLTSGTSVLTSTVSAATTVYYALHTGRYVPLYNGSAWTMTDIGAELSQATTDSTKSPAACATNSNYDLFVWDDSGTYRCTRGPAWSSDTARGTGAGTTELERVQGIWVNKIAITNGPAAQRGTYVGTVRTNGTSTVDFNLGSTASGGGAALINVWNAYNRVQVQASVADSTANWNNTVSTWRSANNSATNRISFVHGLTVEPVSATYLNVVSAGTGAPKTGINLDSTTATPGPFQGYVQPSTLNATTVAAYGGYPGLGFHYIQAMESWNTGSTYYGNGSQLLTGELFA